MPRLKYAILRNEPTVFAAEISYIIHDTRYLCRLQMVFAGGFVLENEPTGRVFSGGVWRESGVAFEDEARIHGYVTWIFYDGLSNQDTIPHLAVTPRSMELVG